MKNTIEILAPIKEPYDISVAKDTECHGFYVDHDYFIHNGFECIKEFKYHAKKFGVKFYINFKHTIDEWEVNNIRKIITYLSLSPIDGILVNSFALLEMLTEYPALPFKIIIDSALNIHNLAAMDFIKSFKLVEGINITEEIYTKNISTLKKYTHQKFAINSDNIPWCIGDIKKTKAVNLIIIKADFDTKEELKEGIELVRNIIDKPKFHRNQKLPFKQPKVTAYETNHFTGRFINEKGNEFSFSGNIKKYDRSYSLVKISKDIDISKIKLPRLNLRLTGLEQIKSLKTFISKYNFNPVYSIEYGEIVSTADLSKNSFNEILEKIKLFCLEYGIKLQISTPRAIIERDFERVYEYVKMLCLQDPIPSALVANNIGFWWTVINDPDYENIPIEIGNGISLLSSLSIKCLARKHPIEAVDLSAFKKFSAIKSCADHIKEIIPTRKLTVGGSIRIPASGLCPLNSNPAILSRLSCPAPCHHGNYAVFDPDLQKPFPLCVDGFCRMHLFDTQILDVFRFVPLLEEAGVNEFVIDFTALDAKLVTVLLTRFINALAQNSAYKTDINFKNSYYNLK